MHGKQKTGLDICMIMFEQTLERSIFLLFAFQNYILVFLLFSWNFSVSRGRFAFAEFLHEQLASLRSLGEGKAREEAESEGRERLFRLCSLRKGKRCQGQDGWCQHREATRRVLAINSLISLIKIPPTGEGVQGPFDRAPTGIIQLVREACVSCPIGGR